MATSPVTNIITNKITANDFRGDVESNFNSLADVYGETLAAEQLRLEHEAYTLGEARFIKTLNRQIGRNEFSDNATAKPVLNDLIPKVSEGIQKFIESNTQAGKKGRKHLALKPLLQLPVESSALIAMKCVLTCLTQEGPIQKVANMIGSAIEDEIRYGRIREAEGNHFKKYVKAALDKRAGASYKKAYMQAVESSMLAEGQLKDSWIHWEKNLVINLGVKLIEIVIETTGIVELHRINVGTKAEAETIRLTQKYIEYFTGRARQLAGISPILQPCVVPPKPWVDVRGGGYYAMGRKPISMIRTGSRKALERYADVDMPTVYEALNSIQQTAWKVNKDVLQVVNAMSDYTHPLANIPSTEQAELPAKPEDINEDEVSAKKWRKAAAGVYRREKARQSRRMSFEFITAQANKFVEYGAIWFPHNMDWRGRIYAIPMFNPQGNDLTKGLLSFAEGHALGAEGAYWLALHGANCAGFDKEDLDERVQWVKDRQDLILECAKSPLDNLWWSEQDSPWCFLQFCFEWAGYVSQGESYVSHLAVAFDGTCSGLQHFSAMLRDEVGGKAVNLCKGFKRQDIYKIVADKVNIEIDELLASGSEDSMKLLENTKTGEVTERIIYGEKTIASWWKAYGVTRGVTKRSVMTLAYGSKEYGFADQILEDTLRPASDDGKADMFIDIQQAARFLAKLIWKAVGVTVIAAVEAMEWLQACANLLATKVIDKKTDEVLKDCLPVHWVTPAGFPVWQEYRKMEQKRLDILFLGSFRLQPTINVRESNELDTRLQTTGIAPNFVHSQDASHLQLTVCHSKKTYGITSFAMIHDSFGTHAAKAGGMFKGVRETMVDTYTKYDVIEEFYKQFEGQLHESQLEDMPPVPSKGNLNLMEVLESNFAFS